MTTRNEPQAVRLHGRAFWITGDALVPVIAGGDRDDDPTANIPTLDELRERRAAVVQEIDDIIDTARDEERDLSDDERARHDTLAGEFDDLDTQITRAEAHESDVRRFTEHDRRRRYAVPMVNTITDAPVSASRSLDELLWASSETVDAGSFDQHGKWNPSPYGARNNVEQVAVRSAGGDLLVVSPRIDEFRPDHQATIRRFQTTVADMLVFGALTAKRGSTANSADLFNVARAHPHMKARWDRVMRAMDVDTTAEGGTWVPTGIGADLHEKVRAAGRIAPLFGRIDLPTNPWKWPIEGADATAYRVGEPTGDTETKVTASTPGTGAATFDAEIFGARTLFSRSLDADSALAILPYARGKLVQAFVDAEEKAILDGDSDGSHQDSDVSGTADARTAWDGLRKRALANASSDHSNAALSVAGLRTTRALMGKWGLDPMQTVYIVGVSSYYDLIGDSEVTTVEKYGGQATILNGELARVNGSPVIVSEHVRENLNASGVHDGITTNRSYALAVNRGEWVMGQRMALDIEVDDSIYRETFQRVVVGFQREDFQNVGDASTNDDTAVLYNVAP